MAFGQNKNLRVKILKSFIWYKSTQNLMEINSFRAFFKFLSGKYFLSIYVTVVKIVNYHPAILLTCAGYQLAQIAAGKRPFPNRVISFFSQLSFLYCQNNSHKNGQKTFFSNITSKLMIHVQQSYRKNHLQTCIRVLRSLSSSNFFWHEKLKCAELTINYIWLWQK